MSLPTLSRCVAVSVNCEESYEYSLATGRAKGEAWVQISRQAGPLKMLLAVALEPLLSRAANKLAQRYKR